MSESIIHLLSEIIKNGHCHPAIFSCYQLPDGLERIEDKDGNIQIRVDDTNKTFKVNIEALWNKVDNIKVSKEITISPKTGIINWIREHKLICGGAGGMGVAGVIIAWIIWRSGEDKSKEGNVVFTFTF